jgi:hypothetical protein
MAANGAKRAFISKYSNSTDSCVVRSYRQPSAVPLYVSSAIHTATCSSRTNEDKRRAVIKLLKTEFNRDRRFASPPQNCADMRHFPPCPLRPQLSPCWGRFFSQTARRHFDRASLKKVLMVTVRSYLKNITNNKAL